MLEFVIKTWHAKHLPKWLITICEYGSREYCGIYKADTIQLTDGQMHVIIRKYSENMFL